MNKNFLKSLISVNAKVIASFFCFSFSAYGASIDQSQTEVTASLGIQAFSPVGQKFQPSAEQISHISVQLLDAGGGQQGNWAHINIREDNINGEIIASSHQQYLEDCFNFEAGPGCGLGGGTGKEVTFSFPDTVALSPEKSYAFELIADEQGDGLNVGYTNNNGYSQGGLYLDGQYHEHDLWFKTYFQNSPTILISSAQNISSFDLELNLLSNIAIPANEQGAPSRDIIEHPFLGTFVFNGVFKPELSQFLEGSWNSYIEPGWSIVNNISYGGIAGFGNHIYAGDMRTAQNGEQKGIVRFDFINTQSQKRFFPDNEYIDLTLGLDNKLYGLQSSRGTVDIINPITMVLENSLRVGTRTDYRAVTADQQGNLFYVTWSGLIGKTDSTGTSVNEISVGQSLMDIDIHQNAGLLVSSRNGEVWLLNQQLDITQHLDTGIWNTFVAFGEATTQVTQNTPIEYCQAQGNNTFYEWIERMVLNNQNVSSGDNSGYFLHPAPITLKAGSNNLELEPGFGNNQYNEHWSLWLDINNDGAFSLDELIFNEQSNSRIISAFNIPPQENTLHTRLRIAMRYGGSAEACGNFTYGEVEDFEVIIEPAQ
ncbi:GEVED domain-containing protein [Marinagarivorans cellulosilyticus]|uniref:GEVED domain-containing protein n=1 Tax=Marinagarivorans cellulosilyticus TaxID=2721545 RepID=A0AAN1WGC1_9GAMM|nr:GEVED domain-containing protein [Marinagarivorans cellulosilyticus]BCD97090.1 hypothetical protein MARGE09_P1290 [Marinagarivorans cellulosilyticus]